MHRNNRLIFRAVLAGVLLAAGLGVPAAPLGAQQPAQAAPAAAGGALLVGLKPGARLSFGPSGLSASDSALSASLSHLNVQSAANVFRAVAGSGQVRLAGIASAIDLRSVYRLRLPAGADVAAAASALRANPAVVYVEPDAIAHLITTPNDPLLAQQWGLAQIGAPGAWSVVTGSASVAIAVIDSGIDTTQPDLVGQLWTNPGEIAANSLDDDNDGHVDDVHGWNLLGDNADLSDNNGHGTEVAGIAAAATNNGLGVAGVCWTCKLMVVKVAQPSGVANYSDIAAGVAYAAQKGAKVINLSLGGNSDSITLRAAIESAAATAVIVGGAGNDNSSALFYPAAYPDVLAVAGTTMTDTKVADSNFGAWVDVTAPGEAITTTFSGGTWGASSGTSLAAPFASGLAGLLFAEHPGWSPAQVRAQIIHTAHNIDAGNPSYVGQLGSGRIDAASAISTSAVPDISISSLAVNGQLNGTANRGALSDLTITLTNAWAPATNLQATLTGGGAHASVVSGTVSYGTIDTYASQANSATLRISVTMAAGFGASLPFTLHLTADGGFSANFPVTITTQSTTQDVHGIISTNTVWTSDQIYHVTSNIGVNSGITLTIQPGTVVKFETGSELDIAGTLIAIGTADQPILFTSAQANQVWTGIVFMNSSSDSTYDGSLNYTGGSVLRHAIVEYGGDISLDDAAPYIGDNTLSHMGSGEGISGSANGNVWPAIVNNTLNGTGIRLDWSGGGFYIMGNKLVGAVLYAHGAGTVAHNSITGSPGLGMDIDYADVIANRVIDSAEGIRITSTGLISGNLVANNKGNGLRVFNSPTITNNTFVGNAGAAFVVDSGGPSVPHHNNIIAKTGQLALKNNTGSAVNATNNWWGTTDTAAIDNLILDGHDIFATGVVTYNPVLSGPESGAPAYVQAVDIQPDTTLGIQTGTFAVHFSRPMDQSVNPILTFGSTAPYDTYRIANNATWLDATHWQATYDVTSLVPRGPFTLSVASAQGLDGIEIAPDSRFTFTVDYAGQITDQSPPNQPFVFADGAVGNPGYVTAHWLATDPNSPIIHYRYAIGSTPGAVDIVNWTTIDAMTVTRNGLGLIASQHYWVSLQAQNQGGLWSPIGSSRFTAGAKNPRVFLAVIQR